MQPKELRFYNILTQLGTVNLQQGNEELSQLNDIFKYFIFQIHFAWSFEPCSFLTLAEELIFKIDS